MMKYLRACLKIAFCRMYVSDCGELDVLAISPDQQYKRLKVL